MFIHPALIRAALAYMCFYLLTSGLFSVVYYAIASSRGDLSPFSKWFYFSLMTFATISYEEVSIYPDMWNIISAQFLINSLVTPIMAGIIFYYVLNRPPKIIFPKKLIVRRRTSEGSLGLLTISVKVANAHRYKVYDVQCRLLYSYYKPEYDAYNRETTFTGAIPYIDKTYRFSYELHQFPIVFLETYLFKNSINYINDEILIIVSGKYGSLSDPFIIEKEYRFADIEVARDTERLYRYNETNGRLLNRTRIEYGNLDALIPCTEDERTQINEEIRKIIDKKRVQQLDHAELTEKMIG